MAAIVDTNIILYRFDPSSPQKQTVVDGLLRKGLAAGTLYIPHQAIVEFVAAATRSRGGRLPLLSPRVAFREAEELLTQFMVLYPNENLVRTALRGAAAYQLSWYDAHMWAYAECNGMSELLSEDFTHQRRYGSVLAVNPFLP